MSMEHVLDAAALDTLSSSTKLALMAIADDASDRSNLSMPGLEKICEWANVKERRALEMIAALVKANYIERYSPGFPGQRAVYLVSLPPRPRRPVDNPEIMGAGSRMRSKTTHALSTGMGAGSRTPLRRQKLINQSSEIAHLELPVDNPTTTTTNDNSPNDPEHRTLIDRLLGRKRLGIDLEAIASGSRPMFGDQVAADPGFIDRLDEISIDIVHRGGRAVRNPTAYVLGAFRQEPTLWRKRMSELLGRWDSDDEEAKASTW